MNYGCCSMCFSFGFNYCCSRNRILVGNTPLDWSYYFSLNFEGCKVRFHNYHKIVCGSCRVAFQFQSLVLCFWEIRLARLNFWGLRSKMSSIKSNIIYGKGSVWDKQCYHSIETIPLICSAYQRDCLYVMVTLPKFATWTHG